MRAVIAFIVWWYAATTAFHYGGIWHSRANPKEGVVVLNNDQRIVGSLTRDWENNWVLDAEGGRYRFKDYKLMQIPFPQGANVPSVFGSWRMTLPVYLVSTLFLIFLLADILGFRRRSDKSQSKERGLV